MTMTMRDRRVLEYNRVHRHNLTQTLPIMPTEISDIEYITQFKSGEAQAFGKLYDRYAERIYRFVYYKIFNKEVTEDIVSDVFYKALEKIGSYNPEKGPFSAWLYQIARNTIIDKYRTRKEVDNIEDYFDLGELDRTEEKIDAQELLKKVSHHLATLTPRQREIVTLRVWEELSYREIALIVGSTENAVKMSFSRTIREIRSTMGPLAVILLLLLKP